MNTELHPYAHLLGLEIIEVGIGTAVVQATVEERHTNKIGIAHGGFMHSVADFAFELASNSHGVVAVALTTSMQFHRPLSVGAVVKAVAKEKHLGRTTASYQIDLISEDKVVASFTGTVYRKN
ncbi:MAG: hotdog fold thioesterase [Bacteroidota bacterium]